MMDFTFLKFESQTALADALAARIAKMLRGAISKRGYASLVVSGGTTPVPMFAALSQVDLEWDNVLISLVDERWVNITEKDSNENLVRTHLLRNNTGSETTSAI